MWPTCRYRWLLAISDAQAQLIEVREALLADYYDAGVAAFNRELWLEAIGWFDKDFGLGFVLSRYGRSKSASHG